MLRFLYQSKFGKLIRPLFTNQAYASKLAGRIANLKFSKRFIDPFIKKNKINMDDFVIPEGGYRNFNEFFYRKLKPGKRGINFDKNAVISAADCKVFAIQELGEKSRFFVKEHKFSLSKFLNDKDLVNDYKEGTLILFRLSPEDYHRFHFPFDCIPGKARIIQGKFESVNPVAYGYGVPLTENERHLIKLDSEDFGQVLFMVVGAMFVGSIIETYTANTQYQRGDEVGYFAFGGSSIVMIFKKGAVKVCDEIIKNSTKGTETRLKMGQAVAEKVRP